MPDSHNLEKLDASSSSFDFQAQPHWGPDNTYYPPGYDPLSGAWIDPAYEQAYAQGYVWEAAVQNWVPLHPDEQPVGEEQSVRQKISSPHHFWTAIPEDLPRVASPQDSRLIGPPTGGAPENPPIVPADSVGLGNDLPPWNSGSDSSLTLDNEVQTHAVLPQDNATEKTDIELDVVETDEPVVLKSASPKSDAERVTSIPITRLAPPRQSAKSENPVVVGDHRVIVHFLDGQVKRGMIRGAKMDEERIPLELASGQPAEQLSTHKLKAVFFLLPAGEKPPVSSGQKLRVTFNDERQITGYVSSYPQENCGFFLYPSDARTNTARIYIYRLAVKNITPG